MLINGELVVCVVVKVVVCVVVTVVVVDGGTVVVFSYSVDISVVSSTCL
jgi:hypothetical protein